MTEIQIVSCVALPKWSAQTSDGPWNIFATLNLHRNSGCGWYFLTIIVRILTRTDTFPVGIDKSLG